MRGLEAPGRRVLAGVIDGGNGWAVPWECSGWNEELGRSTAMLEGYCVKCKDKKPIADAVEVVMKNGRKAAKGRCPTCSGGMFKILGGKAAPVGVDSMVEGVAPVGVGEAGGEVASPEDAGQKAGAVESSNPGPEAG